MYYGGKRVIEAYLGRVKVWSIPIVPWVEGQWYREGSIVRVNGRSLFVSRIDHVAAADNAPGKSIRHWIVK